MFIKDQTNLKEFITQQYIDDIFFAVTFPKDALGLEEIFPLKIISYDNHPITKLFPPSVNHFSLLNNTKDLLKRRSTNVLLNHPATIKHISSFNQYQPNILVYKPSPSLEKICQNNHWQLLANPAKLNRQIENKINFSQIVTELSLPQPNYSIEKLKEISYQNYSQKYGPQFFLQFPRGFAGSSTFLISSDDQLQLIKNNYLNYPTKISQKIDGPTYSLNACILHPSVNKGQIVIQPPFFQITNLPDLNPSPGGTCGNIYSSGLNIFKNLSQLYADVKKFGVYLQKQNYHGFFGLDFVIDSQTGQHFFIECNPRLTASVPMVTKLQLKNNQIPLLAIHIMEMLQLEYQLSDQAIENIQQNPIKGSQIIFRNIGSDTTPPPISLTSGVFTSHISFKNIFDLKNIVQDQPKMLKFLRPGKDILDVKKTEEFLVLSEPIDRNISPAIEYLRIQSLNDLLA
ncbi:MAG: hypothetical protein ACOZAR_04110 [Patescibacteria group bacterium]